MKTNIKHIIKDILLKESEFDVGDAFKFIKQKEGRAFPRKYVLSLLRSGDISELSIPQDLGDNKELWQIYKFVHAPETLTGEDLHVEGSLNLNECTSLRELHEGLSVDGSLFLEGCTSLRELHEGLSVGRSLLLQGCTSLQSLPEGLSVGWNLYLEGCTSLQSLPQGLSVGESLFFKPTDLIPQRFGEDGDAIKRYIEQELGGEVKGEIWIEG